MNIVSEKASIEVTINGNGNGVQNESVSFIEVTKEESDGEDVVLESSLELVDLTEASLDKDTLKTGGSINKSVSVEKLSVSLKTSRNRRTSLRRLQPRQ